MMQSGFRTISLILGLAAGLGLAVPAMSAPDGAFGHGLMGLQRIKDQLNLTTSQQVQWDAAMAQAKSARDAMRQSHLQLRQALQAELAKAEPDLAAVAALHDSLQPANVAARQQARNAWLQLYSTFSLEQKTVVKNALMTKLQRMERFREHMRDHFTPHG